MGKQYVCCDGRARISLEGTAFVYDGDNARMLFAFDLADVAPLDVAIVDIAEVREIGLFTIKVNLGAHIARARKKADSEA